MSEQIKRYVNSIVLAISAILVCPSTGLAQDPDSVSLALIAPAAEMPLFNLHSPKIGTDRDGQATLEFSYSQTRPGRTILTEAVIRLGNSSLGQKMIFGAISNSPSTYIVRLPPDRLKQVKSEGVEILFIGELSSSTGELGSRQYFKHYFRLSNSLLLGGAREQATTRPADPNDSNALVKWLEGAMQQDQFEATIPAGFSNKLSFLVPGMTICVFVNDGWQQTEYLGRDEDDMVIYRPDPDKRETAIIKSSLVSQKVSEREHFTNPALRRTPIPFKASLRLMEASSIVIPDGYETPSPHAYIPGLPLKVRIKNELVEGFVVSSKYGEATVRYMALDFWKKPVAQEEVVNRFKLLVAKSDLLLLETPAGKQSLASNLTKPLPIPEAWQNAGASSAGDDAPSGDDAILTSENEGHAMQVEVGSATNGKPSEEVEVLQNPIGPARSVKRYPIQIAIPRGMRMVAPECPLQPGVQLGCNWGRKWYPVTVLELHDDGAVRIRWDTFGPGFDADQLREDLIVSDQMLKKLQRTADAPTANPRQWTDATGTFKIIARFLQLDDQTVVLQKPTREEIRVSLDKLSENDRGIIAGLLHGVE